MRRFESICLEHEMPKSDVAGSVAVAFRWSVKYEKSSVDLDIRSCQRVVIQGRAIG